MYKKKHCAEGSSKMRPNLVVSLAPHTEAWNDARMQHRFSHEAPCRTQLPKSTLCVPKRSKGMKKGMNRYEKGMNK